MKVLSLFCTLLFVLIGTMAVLGQETKLIELDPVPADYDTKASNVSVGRHTITAAYPNIEFRMYPAEMKLRVTRTNLFGDTDDQVTEALVTQVTTWVYRAEVSETAFVEINAATGTTFVHQHCITTVFTHDPAAWKTETTGQ